MQESPGKTGILLVNLGTPDEPSPAAVRRYLAQFLWDPRVVEIPRLLWWPILHGIVLRTRPRVSAKRYESIWTRDGSPLKFHTERQTLLLRGLLGERDRDTVKTLSVRYAMRYGNPSIRSVVEECHAQGCSRLLVIPLYPQFAGSTTGSVLDELPRALRRLPDPLEFRSVRHFHDHPGYIKALAGAVNREWMKIGRPDKLILSFHGIPVRTVVRGDPYHEECEATARLLATALGLQPDQYLVTYQSRFGRAKWLEPYTSASLEALGKNGTRRVDVFCPGFVSDCLETLEEIAQEGRAQFLCAGGKEFNYLPCLNEADDWIAALADMVETGLAGWVETATRPGIRK